MKTEGERRILLYTSRQEYLDGTATRRRLFDSDWLGAIITHFMEDYPDASAIIMEVKAS